MHFRIVATNKGSKNLLNKEFIIEGLGLDSSPLTTKVIIDGDTFDLEIKKQKIINEEILMECFISSSNFGCSGRVIIKKLV